MQKQEEKLQRKAEYEFGIGLRLTHWIRAVAIVILVGTGYYISYVFQSPNLPSDPSNFMQAKYRLVHQAVGFVLIGCIIFKGYLFSLTICNLSFLLSCDDRHYPYRTYSLYAHLPRGLGRYAL